MMQIFTRATGAARSKDTGGSDPSRPQRSTLWLAMLMAGASLCIPVSASAASQDAVSALLKAKTQAFSDAGQIGDGRAMSDALDTDVTFFNENGDRATKADMATDGPPPPAGVKTRMSVEDWSCKVYGNVAVTSFIDDQRQDYHGQDVHARFRSVETWLDTASGWKMIGSETIALYDDPKAAPLPAATLDEYAGVYRAAPEVVFVFSRDGGSLVGSANGGPKTVQAAEIKDVFFTPGRPRYRKLFQRDAEGKVVGFLYRHEGHDIVFKKV